MLRSLKQLYGDQLRASDGDIGHIKDFYFDDRNFTVRYVVADTGSWLTGRQVLLSPHSFGPLPDSGKLLPIKLSRRQIENSPLIETHKPISRKYEEEYHQHYGLPNYWIGLGLWGMSGFPIFEMPVEAGPNSNSLESHLFSSKAVNGYSITARDDSIGHVCDFMMDTQTWAIIDFVIKTGHLFSGREVLIPVGKIDRISYEDSTLFTNLTALQVEQSPLHETTQAHTTH
jgi:uncharacterized protein YrrD